MPLLGMLGATMLATSALGIAFNTPTADLKRKMVAVFKEKKLEYIKIRKMKPKYYGFDVEVMLPIGLTVREFKDKCLEPLEQATFSSIQCKQEAGPICSLKFGQVSIDGIKYYSPDDSMEPMKIPLYSPFGVKYLDLKDESSCHIMGAGATRMGKTSLVNLVTIHALRSTKGNVQIILATVKPSDCHMFRNIPQINLALDKEELEEELEGVLEEMRRRKNLLDGLGNVKDINSMRAKYPEIDIPSVMVIIDEFGAYSDKKDDTCKHIREMVTEIAERAGYLDIHLMVFSQRSDVTDIYPPRVKTNMLTKIAFTVTDENNSRLILGIPDAAHLGAIKGRAILLDGLPDKVQVPYITEEQALYLLQDYYVKTKEVEPIDKQRQEADPTPEALPSFITGPIGEDDLPGDSPAVGDGKPDRKKTSKGRVSNANTAAKR